ncbi:hypothetical protein Glove_396g75 [Diversispora epigaea]|uniref:G-protein coupled receptors family 2 profile 2 domain-containing protein n=1 Tax=Diversispora epigaea TaxID=1348612 RepID=A0A397H607_9GLOM|nr:hypothetical protein Glove_396g75 [Diversispora epigaea]
MGAGSLYTINLMNKRNNEDNSYFSEGGITYGILSTISLFLMIILTIIYGRLEYNRVFVYFCISMISLYIPHVLGAWIYGANLNYNNNNNNMNNYRGSSSTLAFCRIQTLWVNVSGLAAGIALLIYSFEIYKSIVQQHVIYGEWKRLKYYAMISFLFPLFVGIVPPYLIADKDDGIAPGSFFCILNKPSIPLVFVSIAGWNTVLSLFGIYFSLRTLIVVAKLFFVHGFYVNFRFSTPINENKTFDLEISNDNNNNVSSSGSSSSSISHNSLSHSRSRSMSSSKIPIYVFFRLTLFFIMYCGVTALIYGRCLIISLKQEKDLNVKEPKFIGYITASLGIVVFLIFGTSMEAGRAYWRFFSIILNWFNWITCFKKIMRDESFGDWETKQKQQMRRETGETEEEHGDSTAATTVIDEQIVNREVNMINNREIIINNTTIDIEQDNNREITTEPGEKDEKNNPSDAFRIPPFL